MTSNLVRALSLLSLRETRRFLREGKMRWTIPLLAILFAFVSMILGLMLEFHPEGTPFFYEILTNPYASAWWNYPAFVMVWPGGILVLPFLATATMIGVSIAVGIGGATALTVVLGSLRRRLGNKTGPRTNSGAISGVTPSITGLATLGACCCTSCVGLAGLAVVAAVSGSSVLTLQANSWYIDLFQGAVVGFALLAQEHALRSSPRDCDLPAARRDARFAVGLAFRLALLIAGITWLLAMFIEMAATPGSKVTLALVYHWGFEHTLLSLVAITAGMFPDRFLALVRSNLTGTLRGKLRRGVLGVVGVTWGLYVPPLMVGWGLGGLLNEVMGFAGAPSSWGAIPPDSPLGLALVFHWLFQHALLAGFALGLALAPTRATALLRWTLASSTLGPATATPLTAAEGVASVQ